MPYGIDAFLQGFSSSVRWHTVGNTLRVVIAPQSVTRESESTAALVLIVDDSPDARAMYGEYLEFCGYRVVTANNGEEGLAAAQAEWPALILMDLAMPRMDGWEAIRRLRADPMTSDIPIVALSAYAFGDAPQRAREAGADLCLSKPCLPPQVARVVRAMLSSRGSSH
jgi:two-component system cell cycle response regulator DivK